MAAPVERPFPLWILYPLIFVFVYLTHARLLNLGWFWDEAGYYIPAALDFFKTSALIPSSTLTNAHPPLPSVLLGAWWHVAGYSIDGTRTFLCMVAATGLLGVFRLVRLVAGTAAAAAVTLLTAVYPVWFAQSTMAHADLFAAAFTLWGLSFAVERRRPVVAAILFSLAALSKETAIVTPLALALWEIVLWVSRKEKDFLPRLHWLDAYLAPIVPLAGWYGYHRAKTGYIFGNPEFLRYNATANLGPLRVLISVWHRFNHLALHMNLWVVTLATLALLMAPRLARRTVLERPVLPVLLVVIAANGLAFSVLGGALLTRYLLPVYPLVLLVCVAVWQERMRRWPLLAGLGVVAFVAGLWVNPPYPFAPEDNLTYADFVRLHEQAAAVIQARFPAATVLSAWPGTTELEHPELGYVKRPFKVTAIDNFSAEQVAKAAADPGGYDTAMVFSTKWVPPPGRWNFSRRSEKTDKRYYDFRRDLKPAEIAVMLHGEIVWQATRNGEWAAVLHFPRIVEARVETRSLTP